MDAPNVEYHGHNTPYQYSFCPLPTQNHIRILELYPGLADQPIECALKCRPLSAYKPENDRPADYEALSYTWGEKTDTVQIQIFTEGLPQERQYTLKVGKNLWLALRAFRRPKDRRRLWVDALCIDQNSIPERNYQVSIMSTIYQESTEVCVWLGEATPECAQAIRFIKQINIETFDNLAHDGKNSPEWIALHSLMKRPWFSRRWIVQEIALAARAKLYCGDDWVDWERFKIAVSLFNSAESRDQAISRTLNTMAISGYRPDYLGDINSLAATRLVQLTSNIYRRSGPMKAGRKLLTLEALVSNLTAFEAGDPHDTFYAILNLAKDVIPAVKNKTDGVGDLPQNTRKIGGIVAKAVDKFAQGTKQKVFQIDYEKPAFEVCKEFLNRVFELDQSLDIICRPWVPEGTFTDNEESPDNKQYPSWLRTTAETAYGLRPDGTFTRAHADPLVGSPVLARRNYNASKPDDKVKWKFPDRGGAYVLTVDGFIVDTVKEKYHDAMNGNIPYSWLSAGGWKNKDQEPPEALWRTLVGDRASNGLSPPDHWPLALSTAVNQTVRRSPIDTTQLVGNQNTATSVREFLRRVQEVTWGRALITTKYMHLGIAHEAVQQGDSICILHGCSVPVVLRRISAKRTGQNASYNFIGECYVHDIMEGEAFDLARARNQGQFPKETFELM